VIIIFLKYYTDRLMTIATWMMDDTTAPHMKAAMTIPATAPAPHQYNLCMVRYGNRSNFTYQEKT